MEEITSLKLKVPISLTFGALYTNGKPIPKRVEVLNMLDNVQVVELSYSRVIILFKNQETILYDYQLYLDKNILINYDKIISSSINVHNLYLINNSGLTI